jgi:hypothetical protein
VSSAATFQVDGVDWATLTVEQDTDGGVNILRYMLVNDGPFTSEIHTLEIPYVPGSGTSFTQLSGSGDVAYDFAMEDPTAEKLVFNYFGGIFQGQSAWVIEVRGDLDPGQGLFAIVNGGGGSETYADALLVSLGGGGGSDAVPEPATLLLLGGGLFGVGAARYLRRRKIK